jgi:hypothetical protein
MKESSFDVDDFLSRIDLGAIEDASNKVAECKYFLELASSEKNRAKFRWLISAFLNAAYSFFEMSAMRAHSAFTHPETGDTFEDDEALEILQRYVGISQDKNRPSYIKTWGEHVITKRLYEFRRGNTHHFPLSIMEAGKNLPEDFHFGNMKGEGESVLQLCNQAMQLIHQAQSELNT